jgi:WhiB family transcriptional regulator, redox-sensing transcriptional regulator
MYTSTITSDIDLEPRPRSVDLAPGARIDTAVEPVNPDDLDALLAAPSADPWLKARCRDGNGTLTHLFFSDDVVTIARAKAICAKCTLRERCLDEALERAEPWGVWGGELLDSGRIVTVKRPRGRPPKGGHQPLVVDEVPVRPQVA